MAGLHKIIELYQKLRKAISLTHFIPFILFLALSSACPQIVFLMTVLPKNEICMSRRGRVAGFEAHPQDTCSISSTSFTLLTEKKKESWGGPQNWCRSSLENHSNYAFNRSCLHSCPSCCLRLSVHASVYVEWSWAHRLSALLGVLSALLLVAALGWSWCQGDLSQTPSPPTATLRCCRLGRRESWAPAFPTPLPSCSSSYLTPGTSGSKQCRRHTDQIQSLTPWDQTHALQPVLLPEGSGALLSWCFFLGSLPVLPTL